MIDSDFLPMSVPCIVQHWPTLKVMCLISNKFMLFLLPLLLAQILCSCMTVLDHVMLQNFYFILTILFIFVHEWCHNVKSTMGESGVKPGSRVQPGTLL